MVDYYKFDGAPVISSFKSPQNLDLFFYLWRPAVAPRAVVVLLHGVRAHTRLTWLAKRHCCLDGKSPYSVHDYTSHWLCTPNNLVRPEQGELHDRYEQNSDFQDDAEETRSTDLSTCVCSEDFDEVCSLHYPVLDAGGDLAGVSELDRSTHVFYRGSWVEGFVNNGVAVFGLDMQGHGLSEGFEQRRCFVRDYDDFRNDVITFLETRVRVMFPQLPLFLVGVSMSGQVAMRVAQDPRARCLGITGIVSMAGMLAISPQYSKHPLKAVLKANCDFVAKIAPTMPIGKYRAGDAPHWQRSVGDRDPLLYKGSFTAKMVAESVSAIDQVRTAMVDVVASSCCTHILFLHNRLDPVCSYTGSLDAFQLITKEMDSEKEQRRLKSVTCILLNTRDTINETIPTKSRRHRLIYDCTPLQVHHTLANDLDHAYVFGRLLSWIENCLS
eukprot:Gregarina_sp_Pseudo_9__192@NODE_1125_length_1856_cov_112_276280_g1052_i0_p1_GENE_NODE_1125_length_1856_cov_112_276280_g1052_i0NODE_1125_length_1856_cov_112_276280_g1052_i0_p1_ORF_typecomplete_len449_score21_32Hydrolase_4/PF12146_8/7_2e02Hydrolase_4/PF12146_8/2_4e28Abhydrolase_6/PF12697_7/3_3e03Abhydrolase_6/PF12697_7/7_8e08DUF1100/PF06500_11/5_1e02DUF1100/PF06500_11/2e06Abhydrolase_1/PF00561_20/7_5e07Peptidase_S15/PF02129_18/0_00029Abhydrolase_2/PF02230_16/3_1e02Abhydrolase_2/PF02230_16/0_71Acyl